MPLRIWESLKNSDQTPRSTPEATARSRKRVMGRSVVLAGAGRCDGCRLPPRWCVCGALPPVATDLAVDVLMHRREQWRPSSTGALIQRVVERARCHVYRPEAGTRDCAILPPSIQRPGHELWILHPRGESLTGALPLAERSAPLAVLLLDGSWTEAGEMLRIVERTGRDSTHQGAGFESWAAVRCVRLQMPGPGRYWLREQTQPGHASTAEALLAVFESVGDAAAAARFRLHFELHVYATLRSRGRKQLAESFLESSPLRAEIPNFLEALCVCRPEIDPQR